MTKYPTSFDDLPLVLKVEELMPLLSVGKNTAYELVNSGQIKPLWVGGQIRVLKYDVQSFLEHSCNPYTDDLSK
ncbi:helix-turn-helix domain-containing protein [Lawsonibacter sp. LCP25S3_G6]|uniref:helix-turn-helix domain-containing protein n=1 Tax=unclassified Lawsonibacter TaxID=2617946 RepID=UPI003F9678FA